MNQRSWVIERLESGVFGVGGGALARDPKLDGQKARDVTDAEAGSRSIPAPGKGATTKKAATGGGQVEAEAGKGNTIPWMDQKPATSPGASGGTVESDAVYRGRSMMAGRGGRTKKLLDLTRGGMTIEQARDRVKGGE